MIQMDEYARRQFLQDFGWRHCGVAGQQSFKRADSPSSRRTTEETADREHFPGLQRNLSGVS
jgi:hypothetical protein